MVAAVWALLRATSCLLAKTKMGRSRGGEEDFSPVLCVADKWH